MPKSWNKRYQWIFYHKTALENNYEQIRENISEVDKKHEDELIEITDKVKQSRAELSDKIAAISEKYKEIKSTEENLQLQVDKDKHQYK